MKNLASVLRNTMPSELLTIGQSVIKQTNALKKAKDKGQKGFSQKKSPIIAEKPSGDEDSDPALGSVQGKFKINLICLRLRKSGKYRIETRSGFMVEYIPSHKKSLSQHYPGDSGNIRENKNCKI